MRRQLAVLVASTTSVIVIAFLVPLALLVRELAEDRAVAAATQEAQNVALILGVVGEGRLETAVQTVNQRSERRTTVFLDDGPAVGAPAERTASVRQANSGLATAGEAAGGYEVLQPVDTATGRAVVRTFVPGDVLRSGVGRAWLVLAALGAGLIAVALGVADRLARRIARPLGDLAEATHQMGEGRLDVRVDPVGPPEVVELGAVVNRLAGRIQALLAAERELVADLSHRLRTPITALRLDAEALRDAAEAERLGAGVDALERAVDELIRDARRPAEVDARVEAVEVVRDRVAFWAALADDQARPLHLDLADPPVLVGLSAADLAAALDALLENALSYTPEGSAVHVRLLARGGGAGPGAGAVLEVEDEGPGLPGTEALQRGASGAGSTGLGLDIVRRTAASAGGRLVLDRGAAGGALVRLELGPPGDDGRTDRSTASPAG